MVVEPGPDPVAVREALKRVLASSPFSGSERLSEFLRYVVEETLEGRGQRIKDYVIGVEVYRKGSSYDPRTDSTVRVEASRLRSKLARYYETEGERDALVISLPKGGYTPVFSKRAGESQELSIAPRPTRRNLYFGLAAGSIALVAVAVWALSHQQPTRGNSPKLIPLTAYPGYERTPSFSPDASQVAFSWDGGRGADEDIYVKVVGLGDPLRLTTNPAREFSPAWSPDGSTIAFMRFLGYGRAELIAVPALGGSERKLGETGSIVTPTYFVGPQMTWSPDGKFLVFADNEKQLGDDTDGLFLFSIQTGRKTRLTRVPSKLVRDRAPAFAPDGRSLAFCRMETLGVNDVYILPLSDGYIPHGEPRRATSLGEYTTAVNWMPDGRTLLFSSGGYEADRAIFAIDTWAVYPQPTRLGMAGEESYDVSVSRNGHRLAYSRQMKDINLWRVELSRGRGSVGQNFLASTRTDANPQISPDGKRIAFSSGRSGNREIWIADANGSRPMQLTSMRNRLTTNPAWSPDGEYIAFDSRVAGQAEIFIVKAQGGPAIRISHDSANNMCPSWSHDGKWLYFHTGNDGKFRVSKAPSSGGATVLVTNYGGWPKESPDGRMLYYVKYFPEKPEKYELWGRAVAGGDERKIIDEAIGFNYAISDRGVYFIPDSGPLHRTVRFYSFESRKSQEVARLDKNPFLGLTVSPDERWLLCALFDQEGSDLMLVEDLRLAK
jgi:Tol biopolymer transport system component